MTKSRKDASSSTDPSTGRRPHLCIWVVSPFAGQVRKVKLKLWQLSTLGFFAIAGFLAVSLIAGDYVRIQIARAQSSLFVRSLSVERDQLRDSNQTLQSKLSVLKGEQARADDFEREMRERLEALRSVISSVEALSSGTLHANNQALAAPKLRGQSETGAKKGIGGAEKDCNTGDIKCSGLTLDQDESESEADAHVGSVTKGLWSRMGERISAPLRYVATHLFASSSSSEQELLAEVDRHIEILRVLPLAAPGNAEISSDFGYRKSPFSGRRALHEGVDFSLQPGSPAMVTADGIVKDVRYHATYGLVVDIEHTPRVVTRYAHLRKSLVKRGAKVARGDAIGLVGSTGRSTGPHLHYEVRIDGEPRNPEDLIALGQRLSQVM